MSEPDVLDGRYEIGPVLGRGGMGEVRRARDRRLERDVAIKFLRPDLAAQSDVRARFEAEARNAARLNHPNVVQVLDSGEADGQPYMVMECLPGRSLQDLLARGPISEAQARAWHDDISSALRAAHAIGIVHRDVSPANILITEDGRAKIADFGISKSTEEMATTVVGQVLGTPAYLAPERIEGHDATPASDAYSLGVVFYEALTGANPFKAGNPIATARAVTTVTPPPLRAVRPDIDPTLAFSIDQAMARDPQARTAAVPVVETTVPVDTTMPLTVPVSAVAAPVAPRSVAAPMSRARSMWVTALAAAAVGLLLLAVTNQTGGGGDDVVANEPMATTTTIPPTTVTTAPVAVASVQVDAPVVGKGDKKGKGHKGKDD